MDAHARLKNEFTEDEKYHNFINLCIKLVYIQSELPQPIKIRPRMYVRRSIMYEKLHSVRRKNVIL